MNLRALVLCLSALAVGIPAVSAESWTLSRALEVARSRNADVRIAALRIEQSRALERQAAAAGMPQVSVGASYSATNQALPGFGFILNQRAFSNAINFNRPGSVDDLGMAGTVRYAVYKGGSIAAGRRAAELGSRAAEAEASAVRNDVELAVAQAYFSLGQAREGVEAIGAGVRALEAAEAAAKARFDAGSLLRADLLDIGVQLALVREQASLARNRAALARRSLLVLLGLEQEDELVLAENDASVAALAVPENRSPAARPEFAAMEARVRAAEQALRAAGGERLPEVNAFGSYGWDHGWKTARSGEGWMAGVSVDLKVFDGGRTSARVRQARAEVEMARAQLNRLQLGIGQEVEAASLAHANALERLRVSAGVVEQAGESAELSRARFASGALLAADLLAVESRLVEAQLRRSLALADERSALAQLRRALGLPLL